MITDFLKGISGTTCAIAVSKKKRTKKCLWKE
jgi:hypothetical protein